MIPLAQVAGNTSALHGARPYTVVDLYNADSGYTLVGAGATKSLDSGSMLVTGPVNTLVTIGLDKTYGSFDPASIGVVAVLLERVSDLAAQSIALSLSVNGSALTSVTHSNEAVFLKGERWICGHISEWPNALTAGALRLRVLITQPASAGAACSYRIKRAVVAVRSRPRVALTFDDSLATIISVALPALTARGMKGTAFVAPGLLDQASRMTTAQLSSLKAAGWALCSDSGMNDEALPSDPAAGVTQVNAVRNFLTAGGYAANGSENNIAYSFGTKTQGNVDALVAAGYTKGRTTEPQSVMTGLGLSSGQAMALPSAGYTTAGFAALFAARQAEIKKRLTTQIYHFHADIADSSASVFLAAMDSLAADRDAGLVDVVTVPEI